MMFLCVKNNAHNYGMLSGNLDFQTRALHMMQEGKNKSLVMRIIDGFGLTVSKNLNLRKQQSLINELLKPSDSVILTRILIQIF